MTSQPSDFAADVLNTLQKRKLTMYGCQPSHLEIFLDGGCKMWFYGQRKGKPWSGGITLHNKDIASQYHMGNSHVVAELIEKMVDHVKARNDV